MTSSTVILLWAGISHGKVQLGGSHRSGEQHWADAWMKSKGLDVNCPGGHPECTANIDRATPFSEFAIGKDFGSRIALQDALGCG